MKAEHEAKERACRAKYLRDGDVKAVLDNFYDPDDEWATRCKAAIAALPDAREWLPIETAPKDGTPVLLLITGNEDSNPMEDAPVSRTIGMYGVNGGQETDQSWSFPGWNWCSDEFEDGRGMPTHWQPLPDAPKEQAK